ncbi:hypothetical protein GQ42DRAFT_162650 [Ramicandelaber brevisporus]|nr:hypothetical protein GQ42DRAFT_162650 [Ramicandelaber brevisporus]
MSSFFSSYYVTTAPPEPDWSNAWGGTSNYTSSRNYPTYTNNQGQNYSRGSGYGRTRYMDGNGYITGTPMYMHNN